MAAKHFYRQGFLLLLFNFISTAALEKRFSDFKRCADEECSSKFGHSHPLHPDKLRLISGLTCCQSIFVTLDNLRRLLCRLIRRVPVIKNNTGGYKRGAGLSVGRLPGSSGLAGFFFFGGELTLAAN